MESVKSGGQNRVNAKRKRGASGEKQRPQRSQPVFLLLLYPREELGVLAAELLVLESARETSPAQPEEQLMCFFN